VQIKRAKILLPYLLAGVFAKKLFHIFYYKSLVKKKKFKFFDFFEKNPVLDPTIPTWPFSKKSQEEFRSASGLPDSFSKQKYQFGYILAGPWNGKCWCTYFMAVWYIYTHFGKF
jgi:hypothetical protein